MTQADTGLLPEDPTVVVGQHTAVDPSRAPDGGAVLWLQLQELPAHPDGDAGEAIDVGDGTWTRDLAEAYADRVLERVGRHVEGLESSVLDRTVLSPADLEAANPNLVGGDPYGGACQVDQFLLWRPTPRSPSHRTPVDGLWHIGASTHPGPGLGGASGMVVADALLRPSLPRRVTKLLGIA